MKKMMMIAFSLLLGGLKMYAQNQVILDVGIYDPATVKPDHPKMPPHIPMVEQDGDDLTFETGHAAFTLQLIQDDEVIYSVAVPDTTTLVTLPSWIEGECEIRLLTGGIYYFYGYITL